MDRNTVADVKKILQAKLEQLIESKILKNDCIVQIDRKCERKILDLKSDEVGIEIGNDNRLRLACI
jgi:hypothetical protein